MDLCELPDRPLDLEEDEPGIARRLAGEREVLAGPGRANGTATAPEPSW